MLFSLFGVNLLWAADKTVTFTTTSATSFTSPTDGIYLTLAGGSYQSNNQYKFPRGSSANIYSNYIIKNIVFNLLSNPVAPDYFTASSGNVTYANQAFTWTGLTKNVTFYNDKNNTGDGKDIRITSIVVTYTDSDPSSVSDNTIQTYPYTWDFTDESIWQTSIEEMSVFTSQWDYESSTQNEFRPRMAHNDWGYNISMIKGLRFSKTTVNGSPCLDHLNKCIWVENGTIITIPSVKAGQRIVVSGNTTITNVENATLTDGEYVVGADGDVKLTFNSSWITSIAVKKTDVVLGVRQSSLLTKTYGDGDFHFLVTVNPESALINDLFSVGSNSNTNVITVTKYNVNDEKKSYDYRCVVGNPGTSEVIFKFAGNDVYNPAELKVTFTVNKKDQTLYFAETEVQTDYVANGTLASPTLTQSENGGELSYSSSNPNVATVASDGTLTIKNSGTTTITANAAETDYLKSVTASYTLTVNPTSSTSYELAWQNPAPYSMALGNTYNNTVLVDGSATDYKGLVFAYKSSNQRIAEVEEITVNDQKQAHVVSKGNGTCTITAYTTNNGANAYQEISFDVTVTAGQISLKFYPEEGWVTVGSTITPHLSLSSIAIDDVVSVTATSSDPSIATIDYDLTTTAKTTMGGTDANPIPQYAQFFPTITGKAVGDATITVNFKSYTYADATVTYTIHVTNADPSNPNFNWASNNREYYLYTTDFMEMPSITGTSNGNESFCKGEICASNQAYVYQMYYENGSRKIDWYNEDFLLGEGVPDYSLTSSGGQAYIFVVDNERARPNTEKLFIYGDQVGDVKLTAIDPQDSNIKLAEITIHIIDKSQKADKEQSDYISSMSFPYTWDFTGKFEFDDNTSDNNGLNPVYWVKKGDNFSLSYGTAMGYDYADTKQNGKVGKTLNESTDILYKPFIGLNNNIMPQFYGMSIALANFNQGRWESREDRLRITKYINDDEPRLYINGGTHKIQMPTAVKRATDHMDAFKIYVKARSPKNSNDPKVICSVNGDRKEIPVGDEPTYACFDAEFGDNIQLWVNNVEIYWIAYTTEAKSISQHGYATYSYAEDMDFDKTEETQNVETFTVSAATGSSATLTKLSKAKANQGFVIKGDQGSYYFIANARNVADYSYNTDCQIKGGTTGVTSMMVGTVNEAQTVKGGLTNDIMNAISAAKDNAELLSILQNYDCGDHLNYVLAPSGHKWNDTSNTEGYSGLGFYIAADDGVSVAIQSAYLPIPVTTIWKVNNNSGDGIFYLSFDENGDETDGIMEVTRNRQGDGHFYNLNGVRVENPVKGIYIHNGKKIVIK